MPTYEYRCGDCNETFARVERMTEHSDAKPTCPKCQSNRVEPLLSPVFAKTSKKS